MGAVEFKRICLQSLILGLVVAGPVQAETTYNDHVRPIFRGECMQCHNADKAKGGLDLSSYESLLQGGSSGEVVVPGDADASRLYQTLAHLSEPFMPQNASRRSDAELETVRLWIAEGLLKQSGDVAKKPAANRVALKPVTASLDRPEGPPPLPKNARLEPYLRASHANAVIALAASPWAPLVAIGGHRQVVLYDDETRELVDVRAFDEGLPTVVGFSANAGVLLAAGGVGARSGSVVLWDVVSGERVAEVGDEFDTVLAADLSPDQRWVVLGGSDKRVKVLAADTSELIHKINQHTEWVVSVAFSPDGVLFATGDRSGGLRVWETESGQEFHDLRGHEDAITRIRWRSDANLLASASEDGQIKLWDMHKGKMVKGWKAHTDGVLDLAYAKNGSLASVGRDGRARIWNAEGKLQKEIKDFADLPTRCAFSHDDVRLVVGDWTGQVTLWQVADGTPLGAFDANPPRLAERVDVAARRLEEARQALAPWQQKEKEALAAVSAIGGELAGLETRKQEADARYAELARRLGDIRDRREATDASLAEICGTRETLAGTFSGLAESLEATKHQIQTVQAELEALQSPSEMKTLSDAVDTAPEPPVAPPVEAPAGEQVASLPELAPVRQRIAELEAKRDSLVRELTNARIELDAVRKSEQEHQQIAERAVVEVMSAEKALADAEQARKQAGDVLPAKRNALQEAEAKTAEAAEAVGRANDVLKQRDAEHQRWADEARFHAIRETGITEGGTFALEIMPLLEARCMKCHRQDKSKGSFRLDRPDLIVRGGKSGAPVIVPGDPDASELFFRVSLPTDDIDIMPPEDEPLSAEEIEQVRAWILSGGSF